MEAVFGDGCSIDGKHDGKCSVRTENTYIKQLLKGFVDHRVGVDVSHGLSASIEIDQESRLSFRSVSWNTAFRSKVSDRMQGQPTSRPEYPHVAQSSV